MPAKKTHLMNKDTPRLKVKGWKVMSHKNGTQKEAGVTKNIANKAHFKTKSEEMIPLRTGKGNNTLSRYYKCKCVHARRRYITFTKQALVHMKGLIHALTSR